MAALRLRDARSDEAAAVSGLALRSKAWWGYGPDFLAACAGQLTFTPEDLPRARVRVAERKGGLVGFRTLLGEPPVLELGHLFVEPAEIGTGVGTALWRDAVAEAIALGAARLELDADPQAEPFYLRMGATRTGVVPSGAVPGRMLPFLAYELAAGTTELD